MNAQSHKLSLGGVIWDVFKDILFFPFWWYSLGLFKMLVKLKDFLADKQKGLALGVWIKNIFVPMYGQRDWQGALISIFIRIFQIIGRSIIMLVYVAAALVFFWLWMLFPVAVVYEIIWQFL
jgi:hypothetical protein